MGRLPRDRVRRRRRRVPPVAQRAPADEVLPRARLPGGPLRARRRDRAVRRGGPPGLRRARPAHPPGQVADRHARGDDADALHRVRPARARTTRRCSTLPQARAPRAARAHRRQAGRPDAGDRGPGGGGAVAPARGGRDRQAPDAPYGPGERVGMVKIKRVRTIDAVVVGWRPGKEEGTLGSLIIGALRRERRAARGRPLLRLQGAGEAGAPRAPRALRDRQARHGRPEPLEQRPRARVGRVAAGAGRRGHVRPRLQQPHPPRRPRSRAGARTRIRGTAAPTSSTSSSTAETKGVSLMAMSVHQVTRFGLVNAYLVVEDDGLTLVDTLLPRSHKPILAAARPSAPRSAASRSRTRTATTSARSTRSPRRCPASRC